MLEYSLIDARRRVDRALSYMRDHITEPFTLKLISTVAAVSPDYFIRLFKKVVGTPPGLYFRRQKLLAIDRRLQSDPEANLTTLVFAFRYSSSSVLTREYKTFLDTLPRACKSLLQERAVVEGKSIDDKWTSPSDK